MAVSHIPKHLPTSVASHRTAPPTISKSATTGRSRPVPFLPRLLPNRPLSPWPFLLRRLPTPPPEGQDRRSKSLRRRPNNSIARRCLPAASRRENTRRRPAAATWMSSWSTVCTATVYETCPRRTECHKPNHPTISKSSNRNHHNTLGARSDRDASKYPLPRKTMIRLPSHRPNDSLVGNNFYHTPSFCSAAACTLPHRS